MQIVFNPETGKSKGFGFVKFEDARDAEDAIDQANGKVSTALIFLSNSVSTADTTAPSNGACAMPIICGTPEEQLFGSARAEL